MVELKDVESALEKIIDISRLAGIPDINAEYLIGISKTNDFISTSPVTFGITEQEAKDIAAYLRDHFHGFLPELRERFRETPYRLDAERALFVQGVNYHRRSNGMGSLEIK